LQINYYFQGRRIRETYLNKTLAELALKKRKIEIAEGRFLDKKKVKLIKFEDFSEIYLNNYSRVNKVSFGRDEISIAHLHELYLFL